MASNSQAIKPQAKKSRLNEHDTRGSNLSHEENGRK